MNRQTTRLALVTVHLVTVRGASMEKMIYTARARAEHTECEVTDCVLDTWLRCKLGRDRGTR